MICSKRYDTRKIIGLKSKLQNRYVDKVNGKVYYEKLKKVDEVV